MLMLSKGTSRLGLCDEFHATYTERYLNVRKENYMRKPKFKSKQLSFSSAPRCSMDVILPAILPAGAVDTSLSLFAVSFLSHTPS